MRRWVNASPNCDVTVISPTPNLVYKPWLPYVPAGRRRYSELCFPLAPLAARHGFRLVADRVTRVGSSRWMENVRRLRPSETSQRNEARLLGRDNSWHGKTRRVIDSAQIAQRGNDYEQCAAGQSVGAYAPIGGPGFELRGLAVLPCASAG